jgi:transposase
MLQLGRGSGRSGLLLAPVPEVVCLLQREGGLEELLKSRVEQRGRQELVTPEAFEELQEAMKRGEIATISQAHRFLSERGIEYSHPDGVGQLLRRRKVKLKTGRPRHEKADLEEQEAFKKTSPIG